MNRTYLMKQSSQIWGFIRLRRASLRRSAFPIAASCLLLLISIGCSESKTAANTPPPAVPVVVATVEQKDVPLQLKAIGTVEAYATVSVKSQVTGQLTAVHFREGDDVRKGQLLFSIDRRPFEAELRQAQANLARHAAEAETARTQARRYDALLEQGVVAREQYEQVQSNAAALEATVRADRAAVDNAKIQLRYTSIYSPIDGRTGNLLVHRGNIVQENDDPPLVVINQIRPVNVSFSVPEQYLPNIRQHMRKGKMPVEAVVPDVGDRQPDQGLLTFIDNAVDRATGTIRLKGTFPNRDRRLWPGQFADVILTLATDRGAIVVPSQAVQTGQQGSFVFVVKDDGTADTRPVTVARTQDGQAVIEHGVKAGEVVVTDGQLRLFPGARVEVKQSSSAGAEGQGR
jgi:multidrug efflux system membrane fusion protein